MKIPQREDQIRLDAPSTQAGRAVQPVDGSLGDSYITAMRSMAKEFQQLSDLKFDLAKNALQGQLNSFDIYVDARTKQYNQELALATDEKQINELYGKYQADISQTGQDMLGMNLYQNWFNAKGGTTVAGANYAANLTHAQLQIKLNNERLQDQSRQLLTQAGAAKTAEQRQKTVDHYYDILKQNVENGTITEAKMQEMKRQFNYNLTAALVIKSIEDDPFGAAQRLRGDPNFAPILTFQDRMRLAQEAMREYQSRIGTGKAKVSRDWMDYFGRLHQNPKGTEIPAFMPQTDKNGQPLHDKNGHLIMGINPKADVREVAGAAIMMANKSLFGDFAEWVSAVTGVPVDELHEEDLRQIRDQQIRLVQFDYSADAQAFTEELSAFKAQNNAMFNNGISKDGKDTNVKPGMWGVTYYKMNKSGQLDKDPMKLFTQYNNAKKMTETAERQVLLGDGEDKKYVDSVKSGILDVLINDITKGKLKEEGIYKQFRKNLQVFDKRLDAAGSGDIFGDKRQAEYRFLSYLMENNDVVDLFTNKNEMQQQKAIAEAIGFSAGVSPMNAWKKERRGNELLLSDTPAFAITAAMYMSEGKKSWADIPIIPSSVGYSTAWDSGFQQQAVSQMQETTRLGEFIGAGLEAGTYPIRKAGEAAYDELVDAMAGSTTLFSAAQEYEEYYKQVEETQRQAEENYNKRKGSAK